MRCELVEVPDGQGGTVIVRRQRTTDEQRARQKFWDELGEESDTDGSEWGS